MDSNSQSIKTYSAEWKKIDDFVKKKLPQSALTEVKKLYSLAKKEKQDAQVIKSLLFINSLQQETREDNEIFSIKEIEKEIATSNEPARSILNSLAASLYLDYFQQNRWQLYNRTNTTTFNKEDIATWTADDLHKKISDLYLASIKNDKLLQQTKLEPYDAIITKGNMRHLRPTLFDLLAFRALSYFENDERDITKPAYAFEINQASAFDPAADFITRKFVTSDSLSLQHKALLIYQQLIAFHLNDTKPDALIDADIHRIEFVRRQSVHADKDVLYFNSINHIAHQYESTPAAAQAWYLVASYYNEKANEYKPYGDSTHRMDRVKAKEICEKILAQKDSSEGKINCYNLLQQITKPTLGFSVEKVNVPGKPFRASVEYGNIKTLYLRLVKADANLKKQLENQYDEKYWPAIITAKALKNWEQALPATNDLQNHRTEIKIDELPTGEYILLAGNDKNFAEKKTIIGARYFYVSNISYINNQLDFFVVNRDNGLALGNASVQAWENKYDAKTYNYIKEKAGSFVTDANGFFKIPRKQEEANRYVNHSYFLEITIKDDKLFLDDAISDYYYYRGENNKPENSIFLFTDRSLYRPQQTVFFKGIVLTTNPGEKKANVLEKFSTTVYLRDANSKTVDSIRLTTNEFGSFSGKFQLPSSSLNGAFSIYTKDERASATFHVEEYKRPKFYVDYSPIKGTYSVNDSVSITGLAKAYAGNNIDGALVKYRVVRQARFPYLWFFKRWWIPPSEEMEITHGETTTNANGEFIVTFKAIPDLKVDKKFEPVFDYTVYADITDINGETRSGNQSVSVGYKSLLLKTDIPSSLPLDSLKELSIRTENMAGQFEPSIVKVSFTQLKEEKRLIRQRFWERPDQFIMNKEQYIANFPYDEYDNESDYTSWEKTTIVLTQEDSVKENLKFKISNLKLSAGFYQIEITTKDKKGQEVKDVHYIKLYDAKSNQLSHPQYLWTEGSKPIEPGETTSVQLGTSADNLFIIQTIDKSQSSPLINPAYSFLPLSNSKRSFGFSATVADRGGYGVSWVFVKHNRVYQYNETIDVPWTNKNLNIEYATYRDKTLPGSEEKWKLKISGYKKDKVAAEMLASMYDASLDQFYPHSWYKPSIWPTYGNSVSWQSRGFMSVNAQIKEAYDFAYKSLNKQYDELFNSGNTVISQSIRIRGMGTEMMNAREFVTAAVPMARNEEMKMKADMVPVMNINDPTKIDNLVIVGYDDAEKNTLPQQSSDVQIRKNFNETAFFIPDLKTDAEGNIEFSFTLPEALTKWKFQALAHTKDLALGYSSKEIVTQKQLMVQPNAPRFLREGDKMEFNAKVVNLSDKELKGTVELKLIDAETNSIINDIFKNKNATQSFSVAAGQSTITLFPIDIPSQFGKALQWRVIAKADNYSDGEENILPVLTNRMLVTETLPLNMQGTGTKNFTFEKLLQSGKSSTLQNHALTVEYTSNPVWYAVQSLPYLMEYPYECAEQTWNRYYANSLAAFITNSSPRIKAVFDQWKTKDTAALLSNLQKNPELKSILLEETPWVLQAKTEAEQKKNIALLFDMVRMSNELNNSMEKIMQMQLSNGGFVWFKGGPDDRYITQYIVSSIGHLKKLNAVVKGQEAKLNQILNKAIAYLDLKIKQDYDNLVKSKTVLSKYTPGYTEIQYLYMRSFFPDNKIPAATQTAYNYYRTRAKQTWTQQNKYMQGMIVLALGRTGDAATPAAILKSLKQTSITNEELGMYWKDNSRGWWWYEAPIERQALLIEAFQEIGKDTKTVDALKTWLLKNKQTHNWESTKATSEACYALLVQGTQWLNNNNIVEIKAGDLLLTSSNGGGTESAESGTGYFKKTIEGNKINPQMGNITVKVENNNASQQTTSGSSSSWGAVYWQYFEDLDKITNAATPLALTKKLFVETNTDRGPILTPVNEGSSLKIGDKIKVRIELRVDREMEYVHMKDMRASALEPVNVLSSYKWQDGLGYYESTKDASTNFFFNNMRRGTYVFEYPLFVTHSGNFSNGITTIQCMYAPEFTSHSEGIRFTVK